MEKIIYNTFDSDLKIDKVKTKIFFTITSQGVLRETELDVSQWEHMTLLIDADKCGDKYSTFLLWDNDSNTRSLALGIKGTEFN
jgi:hypothetical protein